MEPFTFRKATEKDLQTATALIEQAKVFLRENGVDQWQTGYPNEGAIAGDLQRGEGYVMEAEGQVRGYACICFTGEPCYNDLEGKWLSDLPYGVVHRMAIDDVCKGKGAAPAFFRFAEELCKERDIRSIRVDTDADNRMMQRVLEKQGFTYCGTVCFDNSEKIAFEKLLKKKEDDYGTICKLVGTAGKKTGSIGKKAVLWKRNDDGAQ